MSTLSRHILPDEDYRPYWWPPRCQTCGGIGITTNPRNPLRTTCASCRGTGSTHTHEDWAERRRLGLEQ